MMPADAPDTCHPWVSDWFRSAFARSVQRIFVEHWNRVPVRQSDGAPWIASAGFRCDDPGMASTPCRSGRCRPSRAGDARDR